MNTQALSTPRTNVSSSSTILQGGWLWPARILWLALIIITLGLFIRGIPLRAENMRNGYQPTIGVNPYWNREGEIAVWQWWNSPAHQAGILEGDILVAVNGAAPILRLDDPFDGLIPNGSAGTPISLTVRTGNHPAREYKLLYGGENPLALAQLGISNDFMANYTIAIEIGFALIYLAIAGAIFVRKSNDWLALLASLAFMLVLSGTIRTVYDAEPSWRPILGIWVTILLFILFSFLCVFPVGRRIPRWVLALIVAGAIWMVAQWLNPDIQVQKLPAFPGFLVPLSWFAIGMFVQFYHYRHSTPIQKQQTKWVVFGITAMLIGATGQLASYGWQIPSGLPTVLFDLAGYPAIEFLKLVLPISIAIAILRYRLWDIDIIINRTLVYGTLTASVIGIYVLVVGVLGTTIQGRGNLLVSILATGLVAILVQPLRDRLQRGVNHMMYGQRDEPYVVLSQLGQRLETVLAPQAILSTIVETIGRTLKLPFVEIRLSNDQARSVSFGEIQTTTIAFPLTYQNETVGQLHVAPRAGESLTSLDHNLLKDLARQTGVAIHAAQVTVDLQRSRERLVLAREEERRRLRRDLHDDLGPTLASLGLTASTAADLIPKDPTAATHFVKELEGQIRATVGNIRRLVYDLRPPSLDELGLLAAVRERATRFSNAPDGFHVTVDAPAELLALPAAVEVAAYRIVQEALENVSKHSQARNSSIRFANHNGLEIEITDDGIGLPLNITPGVGLRSMRERAEELGGSCVIEPCMNGGTRILARLPIGELDGTFARPDRG